MQSSHIYNVEVFVIQIRGVTGNAVWVEHPGNDTLLEIPVARGISSSASESIKFQRNFDSDKGRDVKFRILAQQNGKAKLVKIAKTHLDLGSVAEELKDRDGTEIERSLVMDALYPYTVELDLKIRMTEVGDRVSQSHNATVDLQSKPQRHASSVISSQSKEEGEGHDQSGPDCEDLPILDSSNSIQVVTKIPPGPLGARISNYHVPPRIMELVRLPNRALGPLAGKVVPGAILYSFNDKLTATWTMERMKAELASTKNDVRTLVWIVSKDSVLEDPEDHRQGEGEEGEEAETVVEPKKEDRKEERGVKGKPVVEDDHHDEEQETAAVAAPPVSRTMSSNNSYRDENSAPLLTPQQENRRKVLEEVVREASGGYRTPNSGRMSPSEQIEVKKPAVRKSQSVPKEHPVRITGHRWASDDTYVVYVVVRGFGIDESVVLKRFSDFTDLRAAMIEELGPASTIHLPTLPAKASLGAIMHKHASEKLFRDFIDSRRRTLESWLRVLHDHDALCNLESYSEFFRAPQFSTPVMVPRGGDDSVIVKDLDSGDVFQILESGDLKKLEQVEQGM